MTLKRAVFKWAPMLIHKILRVSCACCSLLNRCILKSFWFKPHQHVVLNINPLPSLPFSTFGLWQYLLMGVKNTWVSPSPDVSHPLKQRPVSVDAVGCVPPAFILLTAISWQFKQFHRPRLHIDREPKRIFSESEMPVRHLLTFTRSRSSCRRKRINLNLGKQERDAFMDTVYPNNSFYWFFFLTRFLFCISFGLKSYECNYVIYNLVSAVTPGHCCNINSGDLVASDSLILRLQDIPLAAGISVQRVVFTCVDI